MAEKKRDRKKEDFERIKKIAAKKYPRETDEPYRTQIAEERAKWKKKMGAKKYREIQKARAAEGKKKK